MNVMVEIGHVICEMNEEMNSSQHHTKVGMTQTVIQHILRGENLLVTTVVHTLCL